LNKTIQTMIQIILSVIIIGLQNNIVSQSAPTPRTQ
jgi:hypothetical protein